MGKLKITVNSEKTIELHFGSWVMGQLAQRGWGYEVSTVLNQIASNPFDSLALLVHLGLCSADKKTISLNEKSLDDAYEILDELDAKPDNEGQVDIQNIRDSFLISAFGEKVVTALKKITDSTEHPEEEENKKKVTRTRKK